MTPHGDGDGTFEAAFAEVNQVSLIGADRALVNPNEDKLGYRSFAQAIAVGIGKSSPHDGLVIAVYGPWGSGKSTFLNFVEHDLGLMSPRPEIVRFNPWWFSGQEAVTRHFLMQLGIALKKRKILDSSIVKKLGDVADELGRSFMPAQVVLALRKSRSRKLKDIAVLRDEIRDALTEKKQPVVVFIDDVDRLTGEEIRQLFGVIKAVADFPFVTYLLAFDRKVVSTALTELQGLGEASRDYIDKIVQVPFELPLPDRLGLRRLFSDRLQEALDIAEVRLAFETGRWAQVYWAGIDSFVATPRDVVRFSNSFSVTYPAVAGLVNPVDFIGIEAIRIFAPDVYDMIRSSKTEFAGGVTGIGVLGGTTDPLVAVRSFHEAARSQLPKHKSTDSANRLVEVLFPKVGAAFGSPTPGSSLEDGWRRTLRVCSPDVFDIYFRFGVSTGEVSPVELRALISDGGERVGPYLEDLATSDDPQSAQRVLDRLVDFAGSDELPQHKAEEIVLDLFDMGDELLRNVPDPAGVFEFGIDISIGRLIRRLLTDVAEEARFELLQLGVTNGRSLSLIVREVSSFGREHEESSGGPTREPMLIAEHAAKLRELALARIRQAANSNELADAPGLPNILWRWNEWSSPEEPQRWASELVADDEGLALFLEAFLSDIKSESMGASGEGIRSVRHVLDPKDIEPFVDPTLLVERATKIRDDPKRSPRAQLAAASFIRDSELREKGIDPRETF